MDVNGGFKSPSVESSQRRIQNSEERTARDNMALLLDRFGKVERPFGDRKASSELFRIEPKVKTFGMRTSYYGQ